MSTEKGIALPINMLVILAISIIVLLAAVSFFMGTFSTQTGGVSRQAQKNACCQSFMANNGCWLEEVSSSLKTSNTDHYFRVDWDNDGKKEDCGSVHPLTGKTDLNWWKHNCPCPAPPNMTGTNASVI